MYGVRVVGFGLDCSDPSSPMLVQGIAVALTLLLLGGICFAVIMASRRLDPVWLRYGLIAASSLLTIVAVPFTYGVLVLTIACGGSGL